MESEEVHFLWSTFVDTLRSVLATCGSSTWTITTPLCTDICFDVCINSTCWHIRKLPSKASEGQSPKAVSTAVSLNLYTLLFHSKQHSPDIFETWIISLFGFVPFSLIYAKFRNLLVTFAFSSFCLLWLRLVCSEIHVGIWFPLVVLRGGGL